MREIFSHVDYSRNRQHSYNAKTYNLDRVRALAHLMGNPQEQFSSLHIAGSKGKGSTSAMTESILRAAGYHTGLYTSPHLHTFRERMRIDGGLISHQRLVQLWRQAKPMVKLVPTVTTFEIITVLAFMHFAESAVDWAVIEVGLGGRLDATNVITPAACAITSLSLEHTNLLGDNIIDIAAEKAGIIKPGVPVITGPQPDAALEVIRHQARAMAAPLTLVGQDWRWKIREQTPKGLRLDIYGPSIALEDVRIPLTGAHQAINATVAVALAHSVSAERTPISEEDIRAGLANAYWPGRLETLSQAPGIILDSAHNRDSATRLKNALHTFPHRNLILIFGVSEDKDIDGMLSVLGAEANTIIVTRSFHPRAANPVHLAEVAREKFPQKEIIFSEDAAPALAYALRLAQPDDLILATGSIFVVAAIREAYLARNPRALPPHDWAHFAEPIDGEFTPMLSQKKS